MIELETIDARALDGVVGGESAPNVTSVTNGQRSVSTQRTDYGYCVDTIRQSCDQANPGLLGLWTDQRGAAQCRIQEIPRACGTPPATGQ